MKEKYLSQRSDAIGNISYMINSIRSYKIGKGLASSPSTNYLGLIVFAMFVGKIANTVGKDARAFVDFVSAFNAIIARMVSVVMWYLIFRCKFVFTRE